MPALPCKPGHALDAVLGNVQVEASRKPYVYAADEQVPAMMVRPIAFGLFERIQSRVQVIQHLVRPDVIAHCVQRPDVVREVEGPIRGERALHRCRRELPWIDVLRCFVVSIMRRHLSRRSTARCASPLSIIASTATGMSAARHAFAKPTSEILSFAVTFFIGSAQTIS
jgi:hypothetical protein